jgi:parallel beta-helix repeat protein
VFLIPIVTPGYFVSDPCRQEYDAFKSAEKKQGLGGVILPIHYVETEELTDPDWRDGNIWAEDLAASQWADWRTVRLEPWASREPNLRVEQMAVAFKARLKELGILGPSRRRSNAATTAPAESVSPPAKATDLSDTAASMRLTVETKALKQTDSLPARREIVVDSAGSGRFRTISDAVKVAVADDVILVRPGTYRESVIIDKSITLIGDGQLDGVIVETDHGDAIAFNAPFGRIVNLTIRRLAGKTNDYGVWIRAGRLELEGCDISSASLACVGISGNADPTVRRNRIHDGAESGVVLWEAARGTIEDNDIRDNGFSGISVRSDSDPMVRRNRIHACSGPGVAVQKSRPTIEDNDIFANHFGIWSYEEGDPIVRRNHINRNKLGVWVNKNGRGTFENNDLRNNVKALWDISPECLANVKRTGNIEK